MNAEGTVAFIVGLAGVFITAGIMLGKHGFLAGALTLFFLLCVFASGLISGYSMGDGE